MLKLDSLLALEAILSHSIRVVVSLVPGVMRTEREAEQSLLCSVEVKNAYICAYSPLYTFMMRC